MALKVHDVQMVEVAQLRPNKTNPKKPFNDRGLKGLRVSLGEFGFAGACIVAPNDDGTFDILDANTRYDELIRHEVARVPCVVMSDLKTEAQRKKFVLAYDRHKKPFDEEMVMQQLRELVNADENAQVLKDLVGLTGDASQLYGDGGESISDQAQQALDSAGAANASLMLSGPSEDIEQIRGLLRSMKGKLSSSQKVRATLAQAVAFLDWEEGRLLAVLLSTVTRFGV